MTGVGAAAGWTSLPSSTDAQRSLESACREGSLDAWPAKAMVPDCAGLPCGRYASQIGRASTMESARNANTATPRFASLRVTGDWMPSLIGQQLRLFSWADVDLDQSSPADSIWVNSYAEYADIPSPQ